MKEADATGILLIELFDTTFGYPAPDFAGEEGEEHGEEPDAEFVAESGHGKNPFHYCEPAAFP